MTRITQKDLEVLVKHINFKTNSPETPYTKENGKLKANIGNYHLNWAYGGVELVRMDNEGGGITVISNIGFASKRDLFNWMYAFLSGMEVKE